MAFIDVAAIPQPMKTCRNERLANRKRSTVPIEGGGPCAPASGSNMPRGGSRSVKNASSATGSAGRPMATNAARQP